MGGVVQRGRGGIRIAAEPPEHAGMKPAVATSAANLLTRQVRAAHANPLPLFNQSFPSGFRLYAPRYISRICSAQIRHAGNRLAFREGTARSGAFTLFFVRRDLETQGEGSHGVQQLARAGQDLTIHVVKMIRCRTNGVHAQDTDIRVTAP